MEQQVRDALAQHFPGIAVDLENTPGSRLNGVLIWDGFAPDDHVARQQSVRAALRQALGTAMQSVGVLLTYTPQELSEMQAA